MTKTVASLFLVLFFFAAEAQIGISFHYGMPIPKTNTFYKTPTVVRYAKAHQWAGIALNWQYTFKKFMIFEPALGVSWINYDVTEVRTLNQQTQNMATSVLGANLNLKFGYRFFDDDAPICVIPSIYRSIYFFAKEPFEHRDFSTTLGYTATPESSFRFGFGLSVVVKTSKVPGLYLEPGWELLQKRKNPINYISATNMRWFVTLGYRFAKKP